MKVLEILNQIHCELSKNNAAGIWIEPKIINEAIKELDAYITNYQGILQS